MVHDGSSVVHGGIYPSRGLDSTVTVTDNTSVTVTDNTSVTVTVS